MMTKRLQPFNRVKSYHMKIIVASNYEKLILENA